MKLTILAPALALCGGLALAQNPGTTTAKQQDTKRPSASEHKMTAEIVSTDQTAQQITVRKLSMGGTTSGSQSTGSQSTGSQPTGTADDSATVTLRVEGKALTRLSSVKSGDMVTISCRTQGDMPGATGTSPTTGGSTTTGSTTSGSTGSTTSGAGTASSMGGINSQALADRHCASVTDINPSKNR